MLWDEGTWQPEGDPGEGLAAGKLKFTLHGDRLAGGWVLVRMRSDGDKGRRSKRENWLLIKESDDKAEAEQTALIERAKTSARSGRTVREIAAGANQSAKSRSRSPARRSKRSKKPRFVAPQLCTLVETVPEGDAWIHEIKFDGYRPIVAIADDTVAIHTRKGLDWTDRFPWIASALAKLPCRSALLDGEIAVADEAGATDFGALQSQIGENGNGVNYYIFDLLSLDGEHLSGKPLLERKSRLETLLADRPASGPLYYSDHVVGGGSTVFNEACDLKFEGVVSKRADAPSARSLRMSRMRKERDMKTVQQAHCTLLAYPPRWDSPEASSSIVLAQGPRKRFRRDGDRAYWHRHRGYRHKRPGYRRYNGFWFPLAALRTWCGYRQQRVALEHQRPYRLVLRPLSIVPCLRQHLPALQRPAQTVLFALRLGSLTRGCVSAPPASLRTVKCVGTIVGAHALIKAGRGVSKGGSPCHLAL